MEKERRRAQRDRVLRERRGINLEQEPLFALGRKDTILPDMDTDASEMASKHQYLRKTKRYEILKKKRNMENLMESHSAASADLHRAMLISLKKIGALVPEIRRKNKDAILNKRRNIGAELELEEVLNETPRHVTISRSESLETPSLQRAAAQKRIRNSRDWVVQCRRRLIYAKPIINGNGALRRSGTSAENISIPETKQLSDSPPNTSLDKEEPANIYNDPVCPATIYNDTVCPATIYNDAVCTATIYNDAVCTADIYNDSVCTATIYNDAVCPATIHNDAVCPATIYNDPVCTADIYNDAVCPATIYNDAVCPATIYNDAVCTATIYNDTECTATINNDACNDPTSLSGRTLERSRRSHRCHQFVMGQNSAYSNGQDN
ncbi:uncharacterized protein LOC143808925 [Ranitomeya variabilis]|uniref:uncharacterized protein LOC143808925 n=1 Tax=Ranitomeya variabilis TaxID=490064 RepID=UPI0040571124